MSEEQLRTDFDRGVLNEPQSGIFKRLIYGIPIGAIFLGVLINSWLNAGIAFLFWSLDTDYMKKTLYYAIFCSAFGGLILAYLSFCVLSKKYLRDQIGISKPQSDYREQIKANVKTLFGVGLFQNASLRIILYLIFAAFSVGLLYYVLWGLLILIGLVAIN
ncbi:MAG: hypothetical protein GOP50_08130 [Candidatus Heimdallarchaeota archaeon]|nr:hypothetical protein [Candidatus Heimdallarchaeota archaeon]